MVSGEMGREAFISFNATWMERCAVHLKDGSIVMAFMDHHGLDQLMAAAREVRLNPLEPLCLEKAKRGTRKSLPLAARADPRAEARYG